MPKVRYQFDPNRNLWSIPSIEESPLSNKRVVAGCLKQTISVRWESPSQIHREQQNPTYIHLQPMNDVLRLGPMIGILTVGDQNRLLGNKANFIDIIRTGHNLGAFVFVFTPSDIQWEDKKIQGRWYDHKAKKWIFTLLPIPDVVYNRIPNRKYEAMHEVQDALVKLQQIPNLHLFNPRFFDKWELYQILSPSQLSIQLPYTRLITNESTLQDFLKTHSKLYIKPTAGKAGKGIYYVENRSKGYVLQSTKNRSVRKIYPSYQRLWNTVKSDVQQNRYIVQEAIPLLRHYGRPFDVRVLVQKNIEGQWNVSGVGIRVAGEGGITTHVPQGGKIVTVKQALIPHLGEQGAQKMVQKIQKAAIEIAKRIEEHFQTLGEMSMDIGICDQGSLWFFEANAKPMKFDEPTIRSTSLRRIIEYSMYLSRFTEEGVFRT